MFSASISAFVAPGTASPRVNRRLIRRLSKSSEVINQEGQERRTSGSGNNMSFMNLDFDAKGMYFKTLGKFLIIYIYILMPTKWYRRPP